MAGHGPRLGPRGTRAGVNIRVENKSVIKTFEQFDKLGEVAPKLTFKWMKVYGMEIVNTAKEKIRKDRHIITSRLINSISIWYKRKRDNEYSWNSITKGTVTEGGKKAASDAIGGTSANTSPIPLQEHEIAIGSNVNYALDIEKRDSFINHALNTTTGERVDSIMKKAARAIEREVAKTSKTTE